MPSADDDPGIGSRVRAARQRRGWSREALAFHAGISWSAITQLEAGRRRNLRPSTVAALAGALGVTVDYLVSGSATTAEMLEHGSLISDNDDEFVAASVPFLTAAAQLGRSVADVEVWGRYESLLNLVFASTPLTVVCAYETSTLEPELLDQVLPTHLHTLAESAELVANSGYLDPVEFVLAAADADAAPPTGENR